MINLRFFGQVVHNLPLPSKGWCKRVAWGKPFLFLLRALSFRALGPLSIYRAIASEYAEWPDAGAIRLGA
jgi:hypothetical protein